jgi:Gram-negative porin
MFGGLTRTSSRIAIAAAFGLTLGGYAMSTPAKAADLGGDCCADLEERVAELEATTVRKGNKKVSVTLSGWVVKTMNWWDDGGSGSFFVGDKDYDLGSRFAITGSATIAPGWSAGYNLTVLAPSDVFGFNSNQINENSGGPLSISTLYSYMYVKSDTWGTLNWGSLSPASDNAAVLADISGTVIESNSVFFEGNGFFLRPSGSNGLSALTWGSFLGCVGLGAGIGTDCWGAAQSAVRYDTPTFGGFRLETSYGTNTLTGPFPTPNANFWDIAAFYNGDWGNFKVSAAGSYTWIETGVLSLAQTDLYQAGATVMHVPSGLGIYGLYQNEESAGVPGTDAWYLKPFIKRTWNPLGATILFGEYAQYNDQFASQVGADQCVTGGFAAGTSIGAFCGAAAGNTVAATGSEVERWGLGVVQEVDSAAMHLFARWQHQDADIDFVGTNAAGASTNVNQGFEEWDLFQVGGIIFF